jgi:hypothetical protein
MPESRSAQARKQSPRRATDVSVTRLHPLIRRELRTVDLRRTDILRVQDGLAVDVIVRNGPLAR